MNWEDRLRLIFNPRALDGLNGALETPSKLPKDLNGPQIMQASAASSPDPKDPGKSGRSDPELHFPPDKNPYREALQGSSSKPDFQQVLSWLANAPDALKYQAEQLLIQGLSQADLSQPGSLISRTLETLGNLSTRVINTVESRIRR
ncbi:MAG: hypothetical protein OXU45_02330 [Candidatus Melainabacteria bacterium]|nr:hypothetical protein [Candidatus Melainabacteria bacterium]